MTNRWAIENTLASECGNVTGLPWSVLYDVTPGQEPTFLSASIGGAQFDFAAAMQVFGVDQMTEFDAMALRAKAVKVAQKPFSWEQTAFQNHADTSAADAAIPNTKIHYKTLDGMHGTYTLGAPQAPMAVDVPTLPDTDQDGRAMLAIAAGAIIGGAVIVALYAWGILL